MKKTIITSLLALALILPAVTLTTGCKTTSGQPVYTVEKAQKTAAIIKATAASGVVFAYTKDKNSTPYFKAAALALAKFITGSDLSPTALQLALQETSVRELKTVEAAIAMNAALGLYEVFWGDMVREKIAGNEPLKITVQGLIDGLLQGVQDVTDIAANKSAVVAPK